MKSAWQNWKNYWYKRHLTVSDYAFLFDTPPENEWVSIDCETTGLDVRHDHILTIAAVKIVGERIMSSERLELMLCPSSRVSPDSIRIHHLRESDVQGGMSAQQATDRLLRFIGSRPLVGYNIKFDQSMINRLVAPIIGIALPNPTIDIAPMFHQLRQQQLGHGDIDLSFANITRTLDLPTWAAHDAYNDALMAALVFLSLRHRLM
ncbi:3'-5' exonuclease [Hydromonas duriensis]|uniref:DNA polymerase-3 subunit epsilon n=1 Tax=Hydromonas duriensis TaxID=1527608 RepID=A0A4R6YBP9_9BURK|nr:3'-5' exonuclease [Hydromonas duriensis]TDR33072.1 DNA polymerase-3 subunit epsilon [Hydromonas duriensis]